MQNTNPSHPGLFKIERQGDPSSFSSKLVAERDFPQGSVIVDLTGLTPGPKRYSSVQISENEHVELNSDLLYLNHSCDPSTYLDVTQRAIVALKDIKTGDELSFFYPSTEWDLGKLLLLDSYFSQILTFLDFFKAQAFDCWCGSTKVIHDIFGYLRVFQLKMQLI